MELKNSTVLITGGTSGIGLEFVKQLTQQGATVIITGRNADKLNQAKAQLIFAAFEIKKIRGYHKCFFWFGFCAFSFISGL